MYALSSKLTIHPKLTPPPPQNMSRVCMRKKPTCALQGFEVVSHGIVYFTMSYCGMNWWYYRSLRKRKDREELAENEDESDAEP